MSILIKGMEKPKTCEECRFYVDKWCYALEVESDGEKKWLKGQMTCPLVEIVECKDCKYAEIIGQSPNQCYCTQRQYMNPLHDIDDFCKYGKRRE